MPRSLLNWKKAQTTVFMVLIIRPGSTLKFQFVFGSNECLGAIFSLLSFESFWCYIWVVIMAFDFTTQTTLVYVTSYPWPPSPWIKYLSVKTTDYIQKCLEISIKRRSNLNSIRVRKNSYFDQHSLYTDMYSYTDI